MALARRSSLVERRKDGKTTVLRLNNEVERGVSRSGGGGEEQGRRVSTASSGGGGTQFTCFTGTKVQMLTLARQQKEEEEAVAVLLLLLAQEGRRRVWVSVKWAWKMLCSFCWGEMPQL